MQETTEIAEEGLMEEEMSSERRDKGIYFSHANFRCMRCYQKISNPVCEKCYMKHFSLWLKEQDLDKKTKLEILKRLRFIKLIENYSEQECILCKKMNVSLCTYCFFLNVETNLSRLGVSDKILENFDQIFDYQIYHHNFSTL